MACDHGMMLMSDHDDAYVDAMLMVNMQANTRSVTLKDHQQASRSERVIRPTKCQACVQHDKRTCNDRSLTDTDGDRSTPKTSMSCCFTIIIPPGLLSYH